MVVAHIIYSTPPLKNKMDFFACSPRNPPVFDDRPPLVIKRAIRALVTRLINHVAASLFPFFFILFLF